MKKSFKQFGLDAISGVDTSLGAGLARSFGSVVEPFYATAMRLRNAGYDRGVLASHDLGRPTISVGNITTGGTGKTPVVKWLAEQMLGRGRHPAILLRGYGSVAGQSGDEAQLLRESLKIPVQENPSRVTGAAEVLRQQPQTDVFILDDAFQHRRARRDFNLVLISATQPFGFGHVLPRGLLREPVSGLKRADAFLVTRCSLVTEPTLLQIDQQLRSIAPAIPIYHCDHHLAGIRMLTDGQIARMDSLTGKKVFIVAGIADPASLARQIGSTGCQIVGTRWFDDHHQLDPAELRSVLTEASDADHLLMTEKDWVKIEHQASSLPIKPSIGVVQLEIQFHEEDGSKLRTQFEAEMADT